MKKHFHLDMFRRQEESSGLEDMEKFVMRLDRIIATSYPVQEFAIISLSFTERYAMLSYYQLDM